MKPFELLLDQGEIAGRVKELAAEINRDYAGREPLIIGILKGCFVFLADLMRHITLKVEVDFITAASYQQGPRQGDLVLSENLTVEVAGRDVILVEGVIDTGKTVIAVREKLRQFNPASIEIATLLDKPRSHRTKFEIKYRGFSIGNDFVIGYGLDNTQKYRNLPYIGRVIDR